MIVTEGAHVNGAANASTSRLGRSLGDRDGRGVRLRRLASSHGLRRGAHRLRQFISRAAR